VQGLTRLVQGLTGLVQGLTGLVRAGMEGMGAYVLMGKRVYYRIFRVCGGRGSGDEGGSEKMVGEECSKKREAACASRRPPVLFGGKSCAV
jgi:hypothetical protein